MHFTLIFALKQLKLISYQKPFFGLQAILQIEQCFCGEELENDFSFCSF